MSKTEQHETIDPCEKVMAVPVVWVRVSEGMVVAPAVNAPTVAAPDTLIVPLRMEFPVTVSGPTAVGPVAVRFPSVVAPVTVSVPPRLELPVTFSELATTLPPLESWMPMRIDEMSAVAATGIRTGVGLPQPPLEGEQKTN